MGRAKNERVLNFKPLCKEFMPKNCKANGITKLLHEEIEALYLMDIACMYQEEAALRMGVSRPTFTRIIKSARVKLTQAIIAGNELKIQEDITCFKVAICANEEDSFDNTTPIDKNIYIYCVQKDITTLEEVIKNPANEITRPVSTFPQLFMEKNINVFLSSKMGEGLRYALIAKGIRPIMKKSFIKEKMYTLTG